MLFLNTEIVSNDCIKGIEFVISEANKVINILGRNNIMPLTKKLFSILPVSVQAKIIAEQTSKEIINILTLASNNWLISKIMYFLNAVYNIEKISVVDVRLINIHEKTAAKMLKNKQVLLCGIL